jgi:hypothetical protein
MGGGRAGAKPRPAVLLTLYMTILLVNAHAGSSHLVPNGMREHDHVSYERGGIWSSVIWGIPYDHDRSGEVPMVVTVNHSFA